jgi:peptide deformylase|tara:strand:+ start:1602 stop:2213 length:612 start_codon:yes stop_codon:yes gene_type:complete
MTLIKNPNKLRKVLLPTKMSQMDIDKIGGKLTKELTKHGGLGLSANQIGLTDRVCLINVKEPLLLVNPRVTEVSKETVAYVEQCLSLDKTMRKPIKTIRHKSFTLECDNLGTVVFSPEKTEWKDSNEFFSDEGLLECVCAQHELDHLNGILITDSTRRYSETVIRGKKYGRNERVMVKLSDGSTEFMKYKKAETLISQGAEIL